MSRRPTTTPAAPRPANTMPFAIILAIAVAIFLVAAVGKQNPWDTLFINPLINALVILNIAVFGQLGLAILLFTLVMRVATIPFTIRQLQSTRAMQTAQPRMQEIQKKYKDPKRRQEETLKLYRELNINPLGCFIPMAIQMVVFIALYRALVHLVGGSPESLVGLSQRLYPLPFLAQTIPLEQHFLWLNLGKSDGTLILPILVGISTYVQTRLSQTPSMTPQQQQQQQMMTWMMPLMMVWITLTLPSGVGVYWVASNLFSVFASYYVYGRRAVSWRQVLLPTPAPAPAPAAKRPRPGEPAEKEKERKEGEEPTLAAPRLRRTRGTHGKRRGKRKDH